MAGDLPGITIGDAPDRLDRLRETRAAFRSISYFTEAQHLRRDIDLVRTAMELDRFGFEHMYYGPQPPQEWRRPYDPEMAQEWYDLSLRARGLWYPDEKKPFRFMDLPLEVRQMVYKELLVTKAEALVVDRKPESISIKKGIKTAILRTCRQVYKEASPTLYEQNRLLTTISGPHSWGLRFLIPFNSPPPPSVSYLRHPAINRGLIYAPSALRIRNLTVVLVVPDRRLQCVHLTNVHCMWQFLASQSTEELFALRAEMSDAEIGPWGRNWVLRIESKGQTSILGLRWAVIRLLTGATRKLLAMGRLRLEFVGEFPHGWQGEFHIFHPVLPKELWRVREWMASEVMAGQIDVSEATTSDPSIDEKNMTEWGDWPSEVGYDRWAEEQTEAWKAEQEGGKHPWRQIYLPPVGRARAMWNLVSRYRGVRYVRYK